jgi:helix-turn-helix protein
MSKPTLEQLQTELQDIVNKHNQAQKVVKECEKRFVELTAIIKDRTTPESDAT